MQTNACGEGACDLAPTGTTFGEMQHAFRKQAVTKGLMHTAFRSVGSLYVLQNIHGVPSLLHPGVRDCHQNADKGEGAKCDSI